MPMYRYRCSQCEAETEVLAKMSDPPLKTCPKCGAEALTRQMGRTAFKLEGGGWYADGYGPSKGGGGGAGE